MNKFMIRGLQLLKPVFKALNLDVHVAVQAPVHVVTCKTTNRDYFLRGKSTLQITFRHPRTL